MWAYFKVPDEATRHATIGLFAFLAVCGWLSFLVFACARQCCNLCRKPIQYSAEDMIRVEKGGTGIILVPMAALIVAKFIETANFSDGSDISQDVIMIGGVCLFGIAVWACRSVVSIVATVGIFLLAGILAAQFGKIGGLVAVCCEVFLLALSRVQGYLLLSWSIVMGVVSSIAVVTAYTVKVHTDIGDMHDPVKNNTCLVIAIGVGALLHATLVMCVDCYLSSRVDGK